MDKTKLQKAKDWMSTHKEEIFAYSFVATTISVITGITVLAVKAENKQIAAYNAQVEEATAWVENTLNEGNDIYTLAGGGYLVVPKDAPHSIKLT